MARVTLVRHGKAAAGWEDKDPPLDDVGRLQAENMALAMGTTPRPLVTSPLRRTRETASALERHWDAVAVLEAGMGEVVAPMDGLDERVAWLSGFLSGTYADAGAHYRAWRDSVLDVLRAMPDGAVVVTHFVAINAAIGKAWDDDRVTCQPVGNCAMTTIDVDDTAGWRVVTLGATADTVVN